MKIRFLLAGLVVCASVASISATPLTESTFTEIIRQANVVAAADKTTVPAVEQAVFHAPDMVRTGPDSRVEMTAPDKTITRVGANSVFTFESNERNIRLEKGSILFHPPSGVGGGAIKNGGTAAAVLGTTMVCVVLPDGSFKVIGLEGQVKVTLANGKSVTLKPGEMVIVNPKGDDFSSVMEVNLEALAAHLQLINGFSHPLSSLPLIAAEIQRQKDAIAAGHEFHFVPLWQAGGGLDMVEGTDLGIFSDLLHSADQTEVWISPVR